MDTPEIRSIAIDAAEKYFAYLDKNDKGVQEVEVSDIVLMDGNEGVYRLRIAAKLFDIESIFFKLFPNNRLIPTTEVKVVEYDAEKNILLIKPGPDMKALFRKLAARDILVISDLKFLIERIKRWYELKGGELAFPSLSSSIATTREQIRYLPGLEPSPNQKASIQLIFQAPFAYIWGAPGTGKTQFVLSYAVLHYLANAKRVAIMAPTNNAIEQVLRGVLKMMDAAGVARTKTLRLGVPSRRFAEEYPEVCEERGVMKKMEELDKQLAIYQKVLGAIRWREKLAASWELVAAVSELETIEQRKKALVRGLEKAREALLVAQSQQARMESERIAAENSKMAASRKMRSLGYRLGKWFSNQPSQAEMNFQQADQALIELQVRQQHWLAELSERDGVFTLAKQKLSVQEQAFDQVLAKIKRSLDHIPGAKTLLEHWKGHNSLEMQLQLEQVLLAEQENVRLTGELYQDYQDQPLSAIEASVQKLERAREKMAAHSTEERLKEVGVIACTLDGYVGRFTETRMEVDHIFLDEAGYANISKALTLFNVKGPVTFLGDHMQLPPVCEINDKDIQENAEYRNVFLWAQSAIFLEGLFAKDRDTMLREYLNNAKMTAVRMLQADLIQTFRFGKRLASILDTHVYANGFGSSLDKGDTRIYYVHAIKTEQQKSRISSAEVQAIRQMVQHLSEEEDFVILTPYKKQVVALGKALPRERNELKILTVHGSQGREWDTVILSIVDTADKWFVDSRQPLSNGLNLLNTAVSRTKRRLIIVCDQRYWKSQYGQLVADLLAVGEEMDLRLINNY